jgi:hypothetical protein
VISTYPLIPPASPTSQKAKFNINNIVGVSRGPFTGTRQVAVWPGAFWDLQIDLAPMKRANAAAWLGFLAGLGGQAGSFRFGDPAAKSPQGTANAGSNNNPNTGVFTNNGGSNSIQTRSWVISQSGLFLPGDYIQIANNQVPPITDASWIAVEATSTPGSSDPFGGTGAVLWTPTAGAANVSVYDIIAQALGNVGGRNFTFSVWLRTISAPASIDIQITNQALSAVATLSCSLTTSWQWFTVTGVMGDSDTGVVPIIGGSLSWVVADGAVDVFAPQLWSDTLDGQLCMVTQQAASDSNGFSTIPISPTLHKNIAQGSVILSESTTGEFALSSNKFGWDLDKAMVHGISLSAVEAF